LEVICKISQLKSEKKRRKEKEKEKRAAGDHSAWNQKRPTAQILRIPNRYRTPPLVSLTAGPSCHPPPLAKNHAKGSRRSDDGHGLQSGDLLPVLKHDRAYKRPFTLLVPPHHFSQPLGRQAAQAKLADPPLPPMSSSDSGELRRHYALSFVFPSFPLSRDPS
jgi:hypothetical protein